MPPTAVRSKQAALRPGANGAAIAAERVRSAFLATLADRLSLLKPRILGLATLVTAIAGCLAVRSEVDFLRLLITLAGTATFASAGLVLNQILERDVDRKMVRTAQRPVASGRVGVVEAYCWAGVLAVLGSVLFLSWGLYLAFTLCAVSIGLYTLVYTPLKRVTALNTVVGAVSGAMPPLIGWAGVRGELDAVAWVLFGILFFWQFPHFFAIAWLWRDDYVRGGLRMLATEDESGGLVGRMAFLYALPLWPLSVCVVRFYEMSLAYLVAASLANLAFLGCCVEFWTNPGDRTARQLLRASVMYVPALLGLILLEFVARF